MGNEEDENVLEEGVTETPVTEEEGEQVQTEASQVTEQVQEEKKFAQSEVDSIVERRLARERRNQERETEKYRELENIMKTALDAESLDDVITKSKEFYKSNGIEIPEYKPSSRKEEEMLGNGYANEIISTGDYQYIEQEANRIAGIPADKRSLKEKTMFDRLCEVLVENKNKQELIAKGEDVKILEDADFKKFKSKLNYSTPISEAVDMYKRLSASAAPKEKPYSVGSVKNNVKVNEIKEYYSPEDFDKLTAEDLNNPEIMKAVDRSRVKWFK